MSRPYGRRTRIPRPRARAAPQLPRPPPLSTIQPEAHSQSQDDDVMLLDYEESNEIVPSVEHTAGNDSDEPLLDSNGQAIGVEGLLDRLELQEGNATELPADVDLTALQQEDQYNDIEIAQSTEQYGQQQSLPTESFEDTESTAASSAGTWSSLGVAPSVESYRAPDDTSEPIPHVRSSDTPTRFHLALGLWLQEAGISRTQYVSLLEILRMPEAPQSISTLPASLSTLKRQAVSHLPLLSLRQKTIPLTSDQLPGASSSRLKENLNFFDPIQLFSVFVGSEVYNKMFIGLGEFRDRPTELWHSHAWRSSIRVTSGDFARYPDTNKPIFPSDVVRFICLDNTCIYGCSSSLDQQHIGRVYSVGRDYRGDAEGELTIEVQEILTQRNFTPFTLSTFHPPLAVNEALLSWNLFHYLAPESITRSPLLVALDYAFDDNKNPSLPPMAVPPSQLHIRRIFDQQEEDKVAITSVSRLNPLRGELELAAYGRAHLESFANPGMPTISVPLLTFIDGFGLYRNRYRSLMGYYTIMACLSFKERARRANVLPITIGPHGSNFDDVVDSLSSLATLERGIEVDINGTKTLLCVFTMAYTGDMPQQQKNSGMKSQNAKLGCRNCYIDSDGRGDLAFDTFADGRYHYQIMAMRQRLQALPTSKARDAFSVQWGMDIKAPRLASISPALDIILSRPGDPSHSEYNGLSRLMHGLLLDTILTDHAKKAYAAQLRTFPFPPGWPRVQGPLHHLRSYSMAEHARWSLIIPLLLRFFLREHHLKPYLLPILKAAASTDGIPPIDRIVSCFAAAARSNCVLMGSDPSVEDRSNMASVIADHRSQLQRLLQLISDSMTADPRRARSRSASTNRSTGTTPDVQPSSTQVTDTRPAAPRATKEAAEKAVFYLKQMRLPNMHTALHYPLLADEYAMPSNCNVLIGEDKHRYFKSVIYTTNHRQPERDLLFKENIRQTLRLLLADGFPQERVITEMIKSIQKICPQLFSALLPKSEQLSTAGLLQPDQDQDEEDGFGMIVADTEHLNPSVVGRIQAKYCRDTLKLPTRGKQALPQFNKSLSQAYGTFYNRPNIIHFGSSAFKWCKRMSFLDPVSERRITFQLGDFVRDRFDQITRIDHILLHDFDGKHYVFIRGIQLEESWEQEGVLGDGYIRLRARMSDAVFIALTGVDAAPVYIIPIKQSKSPISFGDLIVAERASDAEQFLWAQRTLTWL